MRRVLLPVGLLAVVVILAVTPGVIGNPNDVTRERNGTQVADPCLLINDIWYCWEDLNGDQGSTGLLAANW